MNFTSLIRQCILVCLRVCHAETDTISAKSVENLEEVHTVSQRKNPVTSYYRHNIYGN